MRIPKALYGFIVLAALAVAVSATNAPSLLNYQGRLEDNSGDPVADGSYAMSFAIYDAAEGGAVQWSETQTGVVVTDGFFNVLLGSATPLSDSVFAGQDRYLEITVGSQVLSPRTQMASVAYAQRISTVDGATSGSLTGDLTIYPDQSVFLQPPGSRATDNFIQFSFGEGGSMAIYEPADSKGGDLTPTKKIEVRSNGLTLFGATEGDTTLQVFENGDIVGSGQITMGENSSDGFHTTVLGYENTADGDSSTIGGGSSNITSGTSSTIAGGFGNSVSGTGGVIGGGGTNSVSGDYSSVPGGQYNEADGSHSFAAGYRAKALNNGSFVWADETEEDFATTADDQFIVRASGGVGIGTSAPMGLLEVAGMTGDGSVNLPESAISSPEIFDEPGLASDRNASEVPLAQYKSVTETLVSVTITTPSAGYVVLRGGATLRTSGTSGPNWAYLQIAESPGGVIEAPYAALAGAGDHDNPNKNHYFVMNTERIFFVSAGSYTYLLEGLAHPDNDPDAITAMDNSYLTATYLPTSYGSVGAVVASDNVGDFDKASAVNTGSTTLDSKQYYQVDLRDLELRAAQARADAEKAERLLLQARLQAAGGN